MVSVRGDRGFNTITRVVLFARLRRRYILLTGHKSSGNDVEQKPRSEIRLRRVKLRVSVCLVYYFVLLCSTNETL